MPEIPDWVLTVQLAERFGVLPSQVDEEPLEWINRVIELDYHRGQHSG